MSLFTSANNWYACFALSIMVRISSDISVCFGLFSSARSRKVSFDAIGGSWPHLVNPPAYSVPEMPLK